MEKIADGCVVEVNYTLTNGDGVLIDSSVGGEPFSYVQGKEDIIPGLAKSVAGRKIGDKFNYTLQPEDAYGDRNEALMQAVPKAMIGEGADEIEVGSKLQVEDESGRELVVTAIEIRDDEIVLDANHPLAGETLHFEVEVLACRIATKEELAECEDGNCTTGCC